ncbi:MAG: ABC transporter permease [Dehalococcoidales bacterium]|nr:ABC transporter permease [Dehalococcoidales bacterium]
MLKHIKQTVIDSYRLGYKDILDFTRDRMMLIAFIIMPLFMMVMMGYIFPSQSALKDIPLGVVNQDTGLIGNTIVEPLSQMKLDEGQQNPFHLTTVSSVDSAIEQIKGQQLSGALIIPENFTATIASGQQETVTIIVDQSNPQLSSTLTTMLDKILDSMSTYVGVQQVAKLLPQSPNPVALVKPFTIQTQGIVPGEPNYFQFMAPGIMAMVVMLSVMTGLAASIAREREDGTLDGILVSPINRLSIILGKAFSQIARGLLQAAIILGLATLLFGVVIHGNLLLVVLLLILGVFSFVGVGVQISALATRQETAMTIMMTLQFPMLFLSGVLFPVQHMPEWIQAISKAVPLTYATQALRQVMTLGVGISEVIGQIIILVGFGIVTLAIAIPAFQRVVGK